jgi:carboxypeptidase C (cathepsin A)
MPSPRFLRLVLASIGFAFALIPAALAQDTAPPSCPPESVTSIGVKPNPGTRRGLPEDSVTQHCIALPGRTLNFSATAGTIKLMDEKGADQAVVAYVAYQLNGAPAARRPVTFVFNGGPGASSVWLHLGALGPWRLPLNGGAIAPSAPPMLVDNDDTWLDFTDMVFIDPPGTGYSQILASGDEARKSLWSVNGDIDALANVVRWWLTANERMSSPKFIVGESYGGFRAPRLARALAENQGVGVGGLVLISPALGMGSYYGVDGPLAYAMLLPSFAAAARERNGPVTREDLADVEAYAGGAYLSDFLLGPRDASAVARMVERVSALTGLDPAFVRTLAARVDRRSFLRELDRRHFKVGAQYDPTVSAADAAPSSEHGRWLDPILHANLAPLTSAMVDIYARRLGWKIDDVYEPFSLSVNRGWDWGRGRSPPESVSALEDILASDPNLRVLIAQGLNDLTVPYFGTKLILDQLPAFGGLERVVFKVYPGGHVPYSRDASRKALREDARGMIEAQ